VPTRCFHLRRFMSAIGDSWSPWRVHIGAAYIQKCVCTINRAWAARMLYFLRRTSRYTVSRVDIGPQDSKQSRLINSCMLHAPETPLFHCTSCMTTERRPNSELPLTAMYVAYEDCLKRVDLTMKDYWKFSFAAGWLGNVPIAGGLGRWQPGICHVGQ